MPIEGLRGAVDEQILKKSGVQGGAWAGFGLALFAILFKKMSGFSSFPPTLFSHLWPIIILNGTLAGALSGWLCSRVGLMLFHSHKKSLTILLKSVLLLCGFIISVLVQQLSARNALAPPVWNESLGRFTGGPLGEPNFETIATGVIGGVYFLSLALALVPKTQPLPKSWLFTGIKTTVPGVVAWSAVYSIYSILITLHWLPQYFIPWKTAAIFIVDFPHPERVVLYIVFCFLYTSIIMATWQRNLKLASPNGSRKEQIFLEQVLELVENNLNTPKFGPEQLAKRLGISTGHLNRKLNDVAKTNTTKLINSARLNKAAQLLQQDYDSISRIAFHVGFNNLSYFNKSFKQQFGLTPSEYRKNH